MSLLRQVVFIFTFIAKLSLRERLERKLIVKRWLV